MAGEPEGLAGEPGHRLREAREAKGLTLAQVSSATRIAEEFLAAIENGEHDVLPPLYVRSFLRSYATAVGLPHEEMLGSWDRLTSGAGAMDVGTRPREEPEVDVLRAAPATRASRLRWVGLAVAAVAVIVLAVLFLDCSGGRDHDSGLLPGVGGSPGGDDRRGDRSDVIVPTAAGPDVRSAGPPAVADTIGASTTVFADTTSLAGDLDLAAPAGDPELFFTGSRRHALVLRVLVAQPLGLAVAADGLSTLRPVAWLEEPPSPAPGRPIQPGLPYRVREGLALYWGAENHFVVRLGAARGVEVRLNGQVIPVPPEAVGGDWLLDAAALARP